MSREFMYAPEIESQLETFVAEERRLEEALRQVKRQKELLMCAAAPFKIGDLITWSSGKEGKRRRGKVKAIGTNWRGFTYRCDIVTLNGRVLGHAEVDSSRDPMLVTEEGEV